MKTWKNTYTDKFQIRTKSGRFIASGCSIEHVEHILDAGRSRACYVWDNQRNAYREGKK